MVASIVTEVNDKIIPGPWIQEVAAIQERGKSCKLFFDNELEMVEFLRLRPTTIIALF